MYNPLELRDDSDRAGKTTVIERSIPLTRAQAKKAAEYIADARANPGEYELFGKNCIDLAQGALDASGAGERIDKVFSEKELDELGNPIYGAGDLAQRRGHLQDIEKIVSETKPGAERRKAIRDYWTRGGELLPDQSGASSPEPDDADAAAPGSTSDTDADREQDDDARNAPKGDDHADASSPDAAKMKAALMPSEKDDDGSKQNGGRDELLFKSADQLTEAEALDLGRWYHGLQSSDPLRMELEKRRRDFYVLNYGNDPAPHDETGRMKPVQPIRRVPEKATPAKAFDGQPLVDGLRRIAGAMAKRAGKDGLANAAKVLQTGLNLAGQALKVDGDPGPKTRVGLAATVAKKGAAKTEEAVAMGGFKRMVEAGRVSGTPKSGLRDTVEKDVQPLFGDKQPKVAAETLQSSLNDLNAEAAAKRSAPKPEPLKIDGEIGPKTEGAFASALADHGAEKVTKRYSDDLGFGFG